MEERRIVRGFALALLALVLATLIRWLVDPYVGDQTPFVTYIAAVAFVGLYGGVGPALITAAVGGIAASYLFLPPYAGLALTDARQWMAMILYGLTCGVIVVLAHWLRASSANLAAIVSTAHEGIVTRTLDGVVTGWNAGAERMYGFTRGDMLGTSVERLSPPGRSQEARWIAAEIQGGRAVDALETERIRKDGHRIDVVVSAAPIRDGRGRVIGIASIERDVTDRKRVERARRASEARLRAIIDNSPVVLYIKDLEGRYFLVNRSYVELFGTTVEKVLGATDYDRFPRPMADAYRQNDQAVVESGVACKFEETADLRSGTRTFLSTKFPLHDDQGQVYAVCGISTDITEETRRHEQLLDLDKRKDQFLSMLAHELRNPLAPIANAVQLIRLQDGLAAPVGWAGEVIERQVRHLTRMVDDLLDIARFNTGRVQLQRAVVDVVTVSRQAVEDLRPRFQSADVELTVSLPDEPVLVDGDGARVVQVIDNLLENAAKYTGAGGQAWLTLERDGDDCVLRIRDSGIGIDPAHLPHVFDLFEQVDASLDRSSGGLGLGLNLVKRMVELHGGSVGAHSDGPGKGSEFTIRLPLARSTQPLRLVDGESSAMRSSSTRHVLVIEDNPDTARSMGMLLEALGHRVRVAQTGAEGLASAAADLPELVLIDLGLPDIDGYEIARKLRQRYGDRVRLVALTGYGQEEHRRRTRDAGFDDHLLKPLSMEALNRALEGCPA